MTSVDDDLVCRAIEQFARSVVGACVVQGVPAGHPAIAEAITDALPAVLERLSGLDREQIEGYVAVKH